MKAPTINPTIIASPLADSADSALKNPPMLQPNDSIAPAAHEQAAERAFEQFRARRRAHSEFAAQQRRGQSAEQQTDIQHRTGIEQRRQQDRLDR